MPASTYDGLEVDTGLQDQLDQTQTLQPPLRVNEGMETALPGSTLTPFKEAILPTLPSPRTVHRTHPAAAKEMMPQKRFTQVPHDSPPIIPILGKEGKKGGGEWMEGSKQLPLHQLSLDQRSRPERAVHAHNLTADRPCGTRHKTLGYPLWILFL